MVVPNRVKWPQEFVLSGAKKERIQYGYNNLSVVQWVTGFCRILREEKHPQLKEHMLDYLISLMEDATTTSLGIWQGPATESCFVGWSKERSKVIVTLISWIESVKLMLKDT